MTTPTPQDPGTQELNPAQTNRHSNEVPMPEQQTGDVAASQHMPPKESSEANPSQPPSERA